MPKSDWIDLGFESSWISRIDNDYVQGGSFSYHMPEIISWISRQTHLHHLEVNLTTELLSRTEMTSQPFSVLILYKIQYRMVET